MPVLVEDYLQGMFKIGESQMVMYRDAKLEDLPEYPLDVNSPKNQVLLKDFIARVGEELIEGYQSTDELYHTMVSMGWNIDRATPDQLDTIEGSLQNACEEQADAIGFFMSLLLFANIDAEDIYKWAFHKLQIKIHNLSEVMGLGRYFLNQDGEYPINFHLAEPTDIAPGFWEMSEISHANERNFLFQVIEYLNLARNSLKCRPWKSTPVMTKEIEFQDLLVGAFYRYMGFLDIYKFTPQSLYILYYKKYKLNEWRTQTGY